MNRSNNSYDHRHTYKNNKEYISDKQHVDQITFNHLWSIDGPFTMDFAAGFIFSVYSILQDQQINITLKVGKKQHIINNDNYTNYLKTYIVKNTKNKQNNKGYHWWIKYNDTAMLVLFNTSQFIDGFVVGADTFKVDFRDYIYGPVFKNGIEYNIEGYDIMSLNHLQFPPLGPFSSGYPNGAPYGDDYE